MHNITRPLELVVFCCFAAVTGLSANPIRNNSFEKPVVGPGSFQLFDEGTSFPGWFVVGDPGNVSVASGDFTQNGFSFPARTGVQWLDLTGTTDTATGVAQTVATTAGQQYVLRFFVGNVYDPGGIFGTTSTVNVLVNGVQVLSATNSRGAGSTTMNWQRFSVTFTAPTNTTTITFLNGDPVSDSCNGLDAVSLARVPAAVGEDAD